MICDFFLIEHVKLLLDTLLFILKKLLLELIYLSLLILVNVVEFTFLKVKFTIFVYDWEATTLLLWVESVCGHWWLAACITALLLDLFGFLLKFFDFFLFSRYLPKSCL